mmetsp:Transcript_125545/g.280425  ORF Transcript_125545/g.280425 Transcript_125545/m.280425 type:complete len:102 (+) Transcript_125545:164-469(+)
MRSSHILSPDPSAKAILRIVCQCHCVFLIFKLCYRHDWTEYLLCKSRIVTTDSGKNRWLIEVSHLSKCTTLRAWTLSPTQSLSTVLLRSPDLIFDAFQLRF